LFKCPSSYEIIAFFTLFFLKLQQIIKLWHKIGNQQMSAEARGRRGKKGSKKRKENQLQYGLVFNNAKCAL